MKKITVFGGGTGTFVVLSGLKQKNFDLGVIVTMMDSGGSTGRLRDQLGVLPPGDVRQCLVALSDAPELWRKLFLYRFENGDLKGHNFGNLFISALEKVSDNYAQVLDTASYVLKTTGKVIPVTLEKSHLCVEYENGTLLKGEGFIDENLTETSRIRRAFLEPAVKANPAAIERILNSDLIVIGPGDLYTSIIPTLLFPEIREAFKKTKAKIVYILNLMTKSGQTTGYSALDHIQDLQLYAGKNIDYVIVNDGKIPADILQWYADHSEQPVTNNLTHGCCSASIITADIVDNVTTVKSRADVLTRSILRHNSDKLAAVIEKLL